MTLASDRGRSDDTDEPLRAPRVSIGLAVYNGAAYLAEAIESILAQTFTDFELIISDNVSTDETESISLSYVEADSRVRYHRNTENIGGARNENQTVRMARGEYFRWAAHDDVLAPTLLERCIATLDARPEVVLCYTAAVEINEDGTPIRTNFMARGTADRPSDRFGELVFRNHACEATYGLMRRETLLATPLQGQYTGSDFVLLGDLALRGPFAWLSEPLFFKRYHPDNQYADWRAQMSWFDPTASERPALPRWLALKDLTRTVRHADISRDDRLRCAGNVARWAWCYALQLVKDLLVAARTVVGNAVVSARR